MKILILSESYLPIINGVSISTEILKKGLEKRGHQIHIIAPNNPKNKVHEQNITRTSSISLKAADNYPIPNPFSKRELEKTITNFKPDVVHSQIPFLYGRMAQKICKKNNIMYVSMNHTLYADYVHYIPLVPKKLAKKTIEKYLAHFYSKCHKVATPSQMMKQTLLDYGVTSKIEVIPTGINIPNIINKDITNNLKKSMGIDPISEKVLIYVSRIAKEKNPDIMLDAFEIIANKHKNIKFLIVGGGPALNYVKNRVERSQYKDQIILTGMVDKSKVPEYLSCGDIFLFPSITETQGLAVCEALAAGLPVVAVNAGGVPENIQDKINGFLTTNDKDDFAEKINILLEDEDLRKRMSESARAAGQSFSINTMIDRYLDFFQQ